MPGAEIGAAPPAARALLKGGEGRRGEWEATDPGAVADGVGMVLLNDAGARTRRGG